MKKAFSLLEIIIVIAVISIISSFVFSNMQGVNKKANIIKVKSDFLIIRNNIKKIQDKNILLGKTQQITSLDKAKINTKNEKLFTNILQHNIISTSTKDNEYGMWIKVNETTYDFLISNTKKFNFILEENEFKCKSISNECLELE